MNFNRHSELEGTHAFLSASKYHWINYPEEKIIASFRNQRAKEQGTDLHAFAEHAIRLGQKLEKIPKTINMYVNDAIGFRMIPEQILFYSINCYGTADAISFRKSFLRIHDLKNGVTPASMNQLEIYCALFCLEYQISPHDIGMETRIYQNDQALIHAPNPDDIRTKMDKIILADRLITQVRLEESDD